MYQSARIAGVPVWFLESTPTEFWTWEAFDLFEAAMKAGIIGYAKLEEDYDYYIWKPGLLEGRRLTKGRLAYFCKRASRVLDLDQGSKTTWTPFEQMFWFKPKTMRLYLHNVEESNKNGTLDDPCIDEFFESYLKASTDTNIEL